MPRFVLGKTGGMSHHLLTGAGHPDRQVLAPLTLPGVE